MSFPEVNNATHPNVLRPRPTAPGVRLRPVTAPGANRLLQVQVSNLGISIIQISMLGPDGNEYLRSAEMVSSQPEMQFTYSVAPSVAGSYTAVVTDLRSGLSTREAIDLPYSVPDPNLTGVPVGGTPDLRVSHVDGRACDPKGAIISVEARNLRGTEIFTVRLPPVLRGQTGDRIDYTSTVDELGQGYIAVAVQSTRCTEAPVTGMTVQRDSVTLLELQVPN
jgi:hypothetical protein